jgi:cell division protein FtsW
MPSVNSSENLDRKLLYTVLILLFLGLVMVASAGIAYSRSRFGDSYYFFKHQLIHGVIPGLFVLYLTQKINYNFWKKIAFPLFILSIIFLILVFVPGIGSKIYGANRWIDFGFFSFQPSEMLKFSIIIYLAAWLESRREKVRDFYEGLAPFAVIMGIITFLLIKQPDLGTLGLIVLIAISIFFISGAKISHMFFLAMFGIFSLWTLVKMESYRMNRFLVFFNPELDPQGIGYQINQALLAIGSGGLFGAGLGHGIQKFNYLPEPVGDSIFAVISEETGFLGGTFLIVFFIFLVFRILKISKNAPDNFSKFLTIGAASWIIFQAFINIGAISGILPLTGITLPFISYGGTSIIFLMAIIGIVLNISKNTKLT